MDDSEIAAAVRSIFDPLDATPTPPRQICTPSPLMFESSKGDESSDDEVRKLILKHDGFIQSKKGTPRVTFRKGPRVKNAPTCSYKLKKGPKKGESCGNYCRIGENICPRHKTANKLPSFDFSTIAVKYNFNRLKVSKSYKLLQSFDMSAIFVGSSKIIKVRLPKHLLPIPNIGSFLKFVKQSGGARPKAMWECV